MLCVFLRMASANDELAKEAGILDQIHLCESARLCLRVCVPVSIYVCDVLYFS